jgi:alpha-L-fucosidase
LGEWLEVNGAAIFGTRPFTRAEGETAEGLAVRFTRKGGALYAILIGTQETAHVTLMGLRAAPGTAIRLLGRDGTLTWEQRGNDVQVALSGGLSPSPAQALEITPAAESLG